MPAASWRRPARRGTASPPPSSPTTCRPAPTWSTRDPVPTWRHAGADSWPPFSIPCCQRPARCSRWDAARRRPWRRCWSTWVACRRGGASSPWGSTSAGHGSAWPMTGSTNTAGRPGSSSPTCSTSPWPTAAWTWSTRLIRWNRTEGGSGRPSPNCCGWRGPSSCSSSPATRWPGPRPARGWRAMATCGVCGPRRSRWGPRSSPAGDSIS